MVSVVKLAEVWGLELMIELHPTVGAVRALPADAREAMPLRLLARRLGSVDAMTRERLAAASTERLKYWTLQVVAAATADEVFANDSAE